MQAKSAATDHAHARSALEGVTIPADFGPIAERLARSRTILDLPDDWDGEGSPGYAEATWRRATDLVIASSVAFRECSDRSVPLPIITKGDAGSIDVQWRTPTRNILVNVPAERAEAMTFYAHDRERPLRDIGGSLQSNGNGWLLEWLTA